MKLIWQALDGYQGGFGYSAEGSAGIDVSAAWNPAEIDGSWVIAHGCSRKIATGVAIVIPEGFYAAAVMRSGHGFKYDLACHIGTVDAPYRGELFIKLRNHAHQDFLLKPGERFAQIIIQKFEHMELEEYTGWSPLAEAFPSVRGTAGFGSTG